MTRFSPLMRLTVVVTMFVSLLLYSDYCRAAESMQSAVVSPASGGIRSLFTPTFGYRKITLSDAGDNRLLLTIAVDQHLKPKVLRDFAETLLSRGITLYGPAFFGEFSWEKTADGAAVTMTRRSAVEPDAVEVTTSSIIDPKSMLPAVPVTVAPGAVVIPLSRDFGAVWETVRIFPSPEPAVDEPKTGRFPGAKARRFRRTDGGEKQIWYVYRGDLRDALAFFDERLKQTHNTVIVTGDGSAPAALTEVFGIKTYGRVVSISGYTYASPKLLSTAVTLRQPADPHLAEFVEIEVSEN